MNALDSGKDKNEPALVEVDRRSQVAGVGAGEFSDTERTSATVARPHQEAADPLEWSNGRSQRAVGPIAASRTTSSPLRTVWEWAEWCAARQAEGKVLGEIARAAGRSRPYVRRCLWLATWPHELRATAQRWPDVFTARVLVATFATSMERWERNNWSALRVELERMVSRGEGAAPRKRHRRKGTFSSEGAGRAAEDSPSVREQMRFEERLRELLATQVKVEGEWIRVRHFGREDLERLLAAMSAGH